MQFKIEEIETGFCPIKFNKYDAGYDVMSINDICIPYSDVCSISLGFKIYIPPKWLMEIRDRSHIVLYTPLRVEDSPATIDSGYLQEITCTMLNSIPQECTYLYKDSIYFNRFTENGFQIFKGDRIAQVLFVEVPETSFKIVNDIKQYADYKRKINNSKQGLGSTGINVYHKIDPNEVI